jgi:hypothetical protein
MNEKELLEVAKSVNRNDQIRIGRLDVPLNVVGGLMEGSEGHFHIEATRSNYPEEGINTSIYITVGAEGDNLMITKSKKVGGSDDGNSPETTEIIEETTHKLQKLSVV